MNNNKSQTARNLGMKPKTRKYFLRVSLISLIAFVCVFLSRPVEAHITALRTGAAPNFTVTFNNDTVPPIDNRLELRFNGSNQLEWSVNGGSFTTDLGGGNTATLANNATNVTHFGTGSNKPLLNLQQFALNVLVAPHFSNTQQNA